MSDKRNLYITELEEAISAAIAKYLTENPEKVKINNSVQQFTEIDEVQTKVVTQYLDKDLLSGSSISVNTEGSISFKGKVDITADFNLNFICRPIGFTYDQETSEFTISEPDNIILTIY